MDAILGAPPARAPGRESHLDLDSPHRLAGEVQSLVLALDRLEPADCIARAREIGAFVPAAAREAHRRCAACNLLGLAISLSRRLHERARRTAACGCDATILRLTQDLVGPLQPDAAFLAWLDRFAAAFRREHPFTPATRVAWLLRAHPTRRWKIDALARRVGCPPSQLRREFRAVYGVTIGRYLETARVAAVYDELCDEGYKITAVADDAGYKSPKDFYRAVRHCLRRTPAGVRALPGADKEALLRSLYAVLTERVGVVGG